MSSGKTIYWHDYETFGSDPKRDRPCQFAGIRTDEDLNIVDDPLVIYCSPAQDFLPDPEACLVTGITPQEALDKGCIEAEFAGKILAEFSQAMTCVAGYNSLRFDDEVTRHLLYRCFYDPYEREWKNGNSRWDIIDLVRMSYALRPEGIQWPLKEDGSPSFRLEDLTKANNIEHEGAHDALSDVYATINLAKLFKTKQAKLYDYYYSKRGKKSLLPMLKVIDPKPLIHISSMYPAAKGCMAIVLPLIQDPSNSNGIIVYDLSKDPSSWIELDSETIKARVFTAKADLPEGIERIALKTIHVNKCPALAPLSVLTDELIKKFEINLAYCEKNRDRIRSQTGLIAKLNSVFKPDFEKVQDPDLMLYSGGFFDQHDRHQMARIRGMEPEALSQEHFDFHDPRLSEMLFRYRGRNYPDTLSHTEELRWKSYCQEVFLRMDVDGVTKLDKVDYSIKQKLQTASVEQTVLLEKIRNYISDLYKNLGITIA